MAPARSSVREVRAPNRALDPESAAWVEGLGAGGRVHDETVARLHDLLLRVARSEVRRRSGQLPIAGPELDDLAHQPAGHDPATVGARFRGRNRKRFIRWSRVCEVTVAGPGRAFAFRTVPGRWDPSRAEGNQEVDS